VLNDRIYTSSFIKKLRASSRTRLSASTKYLGPTFVFLCGKAISDQSTLSNRDSIKNISKKIFQKSKLYTQKTYGMKLLKLQLIC
jgi:hypothetical protein